MKTMKTMQAMRNRAMAKHRRVIDIDNLFADRKNKKRAGQR